MNSVEVFDDIKEIGSEYQMINTDLGPGFTFPKPGLLTFCGRTALEKVINSLRASTALLPSYCCNSMVEPFQRAGINISFFDVTYTDKLEIHIDIPQNTDILLWCNYFGFNLPMPNFADFLSEGGIIIEDITHSFFSTTSSHKQSQYLVASLRKWEPLLSGGYCAGDGITGELYPPPQNFIKQKALAMQMKKAYLINGNEKEKTQFLAKFNESNYWLAHNYSNLGIDSYSEEYISKVDMESHRAIRKRNARWLYEGLNGIVEFLMPEETMDCPLFVPIVLRHNRDKIRHKLINDRIYCPIHWPKPEDASSNIYDMELSLVCDQRYCESDMERIVSVLRKELKR